MTFPPNFAPCDPATLFCFSLNSPHAWGHVLFLFRLEQKLDRTHVTIELTLHFLYVPNQMSHFQWSFSFLRNCYHPSTNKPHSLFLLSFFFHTNFHADNWHAEKFNLICLSPPQIYIPLKYWDRLEANFVFKVPYFIPRVWKRFW